MALPLTFDPQGFPVFNALIGGVAPGAVSQGTCPGAGVSTAVNTDLATNIAATTAGLRYRVTVVGGEGICIRCDNAAPATSDEPWANYQRFEFIATVTAANAVRAIKRTAGTANATVIVTLLG